MSEIAIQEQMNGTGQDGMRLILRDCCRLLKFVHELAIEFLMVINNISHSILVIYWSSLSDFLVISQCNDKAMM
jgi:hypothetical protein